MQRIRVPRTFIMFPFKVEKAATLKGKKPLYEEAKRIVRGMVKYENRGINFFDFLQMYRLAEKKRYGFVVRMDAVASNLFDPVFGPLCTRIYQLFNVENPNTIRAAQMEGLRLVRQLRSLGFRVGIQNSAERGQAVFARAAVRAGARRVRQNDREMELPGELKKFDAGFSWARDQWVKIGGKREMPKRDVLSLLEGKRFGEGGDMIQIGPKEFAIEEEMAADPRVAAYERQGYKFQRMPGALMFDHALSSFLGAKVYTNTHLDMAIGAIPDRKIVAVDPRYHNEHKFSIQLLEKNFGAKIVEVPESEADRHPQNFLPLGNNRVLVDSGAPEFIHMLKNAGVRVIPTAVPLNNLLSLKGGLHCMFNER